MKKRIIWGALAALIICAALGAWAQEQKAKSTGEAVEGQVKEAAFHYYYGNVFGDADEYMKAARMPLYVVNDGAGAPRTEQQVRAQLKQIAESAGKIPQDDRKTMAQNILARIDEAAVQFVGANTAALTFLIHPGAKPEDGDVLGTLLLYRKADRWQVIEEITDSKGVPASYLK